MKRIVITVCCLLLFLVACRSTPRDLVPEIVRCTFFQGGEVPVESTIIIRKDASIDLLNPGESIKSRKLTISELQSLLPLISALRQGVKDGDIPCAKASPQPSEEPSVTVIFGDIECEYPWFYVPVVMRDLALCLGKISEDHFGKSFYANPSRWPSSF